MSAMDLDSLQGSSSWRLDTELRKYRVRYPAEAETCLKFERLWESCPTCFERSHMPGHLTASAWVLGEEKFVLLVNHSKLEKWVQPGGHADGAENLPEVARAEVLEECGIVLPKLTYNPIFDLDIHVIPSHGNVPAHLHYDVRFLFRLPSMSAVSGNSESRAVRWVWLTDIDALSTEESLSRMRAKSAELI